MSEIEILATKEWNGRVVRETTAGIESDYGIVPNTMRLMRIDGRLSIEWSIGDGASIDYAVIGITTEGKKVVDYDGVFDLPAEAIELLKEHGLRFPSLFLAMDRSEAQHGNKRHKTKAKTRR